MGCAHNVPELLWGRCRGGGAERVVCSLEQGHKEWDLDEL